MLRKYQHIIKDLIVSKWAQHQSIMVQMPTGTGKTHLLASVIYDYLKEKRCVWVVAHRRELVEQIEETVARYGIRKGDGLVKVMSIQWLSRHWNDVRDESPDLIVIDEAHHALADTYKELWLDYPEAKKLGMTATPCRLNRKGFTDLFDVMIMADSIADFIRQGWLSAFDYVSIRQNSEDQRLVNSLSKRGADGDFQVKEMNSVLNRRTTIERLYKSVRQYANGKKGIVYAVSISHARNIAAYYGEHGINAVAIDSKTPARQRKQLVEDFRQGKIQVLVNVDVFSEGFDCPDVEFVQMARPTLSLAKYLQQVGRGLRKTADKESCMLIDNVGLYRLFGLPTAKRNWQAMFEGRLAGKGYTGTSMGTVAYMATMQTKSETVETGGQLETIVSHEQLMDYLLSSKPLSEKDGIQTEELKPYKDRKSGLWGLRLGQTITVTVQYLTVFDVRDRLAAVKFNDYRTGIVDAEGKVRMRLDRYRCVRLLPDKIVAVEDNACHTFYIDLKSEALYNEKPKVLRFGQIEMLKVGMQYCSRTKHVYKSCSIMNDFNIIPKGFYLKIYDSSPFRHEVKQVDSRHSLLYRDCVCVLANDDDDYYWLCGELADGSIVIADDNGNYYLATEGRGKKYIACNSPKTEDEDFDKVITRLQADAERRAARMQEHYRREEEQKRQKLLESVRSAEPFQSGMKWGLRLGDKVIVPPIYRSIQAPVGNYCAVEAYPRQWGVIMLDGKIVIEARYSHVEINENGTAKLTLVPGNTKIVDLKNN